VARLRALFFAAVVPFASATRALAAPADAAEPAIYYPTKVGAKWVYDDDGHTYTLVVTKVEARRGAKLVTVGLVNDTGRTQHSQTMEVSRRGLHEVSNFNRRCDPPQPLLLLPHTPGATWEAPLYLDGGFRGTAERRARPVEDTVVLAGTFRALRVDTLSTFPGGTQMLSHWYAPGVGLVKVKYRFGSSRELTSFTPGKD
jgi:hypothetical protein